MHRLDQFGLEDMLALGSALRTISRDYEDIQQAGIETVRLLYNRLRDTKGAIACPLVRLYRTKPADRLDADLRRNVLETAPDLPHNCRCLTLEASAGDLEEWNNPRQSAGHRAIPLASAGQIGNLPMVARMLEQFGLAASAVAATGPMEADAGESFGVFHVPRAKGSPFIPAQERFVVPHSIESVIGFGGMLPDGEFFALLLFSKVPIDQPTASLFKSIGIVVREILLPKLPGDDPTILANLLASKKMLIDVLEQAAFTQSRRVSKLHEATRAEDQKLLGEVNRELQLVQEQLQARERLASLGALTAGIAHEIKNPLNFILNFAQLGDEIVAELSSELSRVLPDPPEPIGDCMADLRLNLGKVVEHAKRADGIVKTMLQHARGEASRPRPCMLGQVVEEYANLAYHSSRAQTPDSQAQLKFEWDRKLEWVEVVPEHIGRVVINLVGNAFYSVRERQRREGPSYQPLVTVKVGRDGDHAEIRVLDNGEGIDPDIIPNIFDPFFTTKPSGSGTGQGLSISHDVIVSEHGGELRVESARMSHAEFIIRLPIKSPKISQR